MSRSEESGGNEDVETLCVDCCVVGGGKGGEGGGRQLSLDHLVTPEDGGWEGMLRRESSEGVCKMRRRVESKKLNRHRETGREKAN